MSQILKKIIFVFAIVLIGTFSQKIDIILYLLSGRLGDIESGEEFDKKFEIVDHKTVRLKK